MMSLNQDHDSIPTVAFKVSAAITGAGIGLSDWGVNEWVAVLTGVYVAFQFGFLLWDRWKKWKRER